MKKWHRLTVMAVVAVIALIVAYPPARAAAIAGVTGTFQNTGNTGYLGTANSGVEGYVTNSARDGVFGNNSAAGPGVHGVSGTQFGVYGQSSSQVGNSGGGVVGSCGFCSGVAGLSTTGNGVFGSTQGTLDDSFGIGVAGQALQGGVGIFGNSTAAGWAGLFNGDVDVEGTLFKSAGAFKIDHPTDPANKFLVHSFVESDEMKNVYDGVVTLDRTGEAVVELPKWFEALNKDFRYQLTCIGQNAPVYIAEKVQDNKFRVAGGYEGMEVSWQVTGVRHDAYAEKHPLVIEPVKRLEERGLFRHPDVFGQPESARIGFRRNEALRRLANSISHRQ
jgi:hypothetical protein